MHKSSRQIVAALLLAILPWSPAGATDGSSGQAGLQEPAADPAGSNGGFFPELASDDDGFLVLERASRAIVGRQAAMQSAALTAISVQGIFENIRAWRRSAVKVCFVGPAPELGLSGAQFDQLAKSVADVASEWGSVAGVPKFDFGGGVPPRCVPGSFAVAVRFANSASNSKIGSGSLDPANRGKPSMDLELSRVRDTASAAARQLILHEFGHSLGLLHEFSHTQGKCWDKLNKPRIYAFYLSEYGISDHAVVEQKLATYDPVAMAHDTTSTAIDPASVMMYSFPSKVYDDPSPPCFAGVNPKISPRDIQTLQLAYKDPGSGIMMLAGLAHNLPEAERRIVDAYIATEAAEPPVRAELRSAIRSLSPAAGPGEIAGKIFATAHSSRVQALLTAQDR